MVFNGINQAIILLIVFKIIWNTTNQFQKQYFLPLWKWDTAIHDIMLHLAFTTAIIMFKEVLIQATANIWVKVLKFNLIIKNHSLLLTGENFKGKCKKLGKKTVI